MNDLTDGAKYTDNAKEVRKIIKEHLLKIFDSSNISDNATFTMIVSCAVNHMVNKQLLENDDPFPESKITHFCENLITAIETLINKSNLSDEEIIAHGSKIIHGLTKTRHF